MTLEEQVQAHAAEAREYLHKARKWEGRATALRHRLEALQAVHERLMEHLTGDRFGSLNYDREEDLFADLEANVPAGILNAAIEARTTPAPVGCSECGRSSCNGWCAPP